MSDGGLVPGDSKLLGPLMFVLPHTPDATRMCLQFCKLHIMQLQVSAVLSRRGVSSATH